MSKPELVFVAKLGVVESEPSGFYSELAWHLGSARSSAILLDPAKIHSELFDGTDLRTSRRSRTVASKMFERSQANLTNNVSVIFGEFVNNPSRTARFMDIVHKTRALPVLIHFNTGMSVIEQRITAKHSEDELWDRISHARQQKNFVARPEVNPDTSGLQHLCLNGTLPVERLIPRVDSYIESLARTAFREI